MIGDSFPFRSLSPSGAIYISAFENKLIQDGQIFGISTRLTIPATGTTVRLLFDPTAFTGRALLVLPALFKAYGAGPIYINIYENPTYTGGTEIDSINFNFNSTNAAESIVKLNPTVTVLGTKLPNEYILLSAGGPAVARTGGEASAGDLVFDVDRTKKYLYVLDNQEANPADGSVVIDWTELR
jgi:hypothetical protein